MGLGDGSFIDIELTDEEVKTIEKVVKAFDEEATSYTIEIEE